jgi:hypothetical protein
MNKPTPPTPTRAARPWRVLRWKRKRQSLSTATITPLDAVLLAVDSARRSGWALYSRGHLVRYGECNSRTPLERAEVVSDALRHAGALELPVGLVLEVPYGGPLKTLLSLAETAALWRDTWIGYEQHPRRVIDVLATEWRERLFGVGSMPRDAARRLEQLTAQRIVATSTLRHAPELGGDSVAAICLGYVARSSAALQTALPCALVDLRKNPRARLTVNMKGKP